MHNDQRRWHDRRIWRMICVRERGREIRPERKFMVNVEIDTVDHQTNRHGPHAKRTKQFLRNFNLNCTKSLLHYFLMFTLFTSFPCIFIICRYARLISNRTFTIGHFAMRISLCSQAFRSNRYFCWFSFPLHHSGHNNVWPTFEQHSDWTCLKSVFYLWPPTAFVGHRMSYRGSYIERMA